MRRLAKALAITVIGLLTVATITLSTRAGQSGLLRFVAAVSSDQTSTIAIGEFQGSLFGEGTIANVRISDKNGLWLTANGISFSWAPSELLAGRLSVAYLRIDGVSVLRKPESDAKRAEPSDKSGFGLPLKFAIDDLDVKAIDISEQVLGERVQLRFIASAQIEDASRPSTANLHLMRLDGPQGELRANFAFVPEGRSLDVEINGAEPEGGVIAQLLDLPDRQALSAQLLGRGTFDAWQGNLTLAASGRPFVTGTVRLDASATDTHRLAANIAGFIEPLVPRAAADLFAGKTEVSVAADISGLMDGSPRSLDNARAAIASGAMRVEVSGGVDLTNGFIHGGLKGNARHPDDRPLQFVDSTGTRISVHGIAFDATLPYTRGPRQVTATARVSGIHHPDLIAESLALDARASQPTPEGDDASAFNDISMSLDASGVDQTTPLGKAAGDTPRAALAGTYDRDRLSISALDLEFAGGHARLSGTLDDDRIESVVRLVASDLSRYAEIAGRPLEGRMAFDARIDGNLATQAITATISGESTGVGISIAAIDGLLKPATRYAARVEHSDGTISARDISISNDLFSTTLTGSRSGQSLTLSGKTTLSSLAAVSPDLSGKLQIKMEINGADDDLQSDIVLAGEDVSLNGKRLEKPTLSFTGRGPLSRHEGKLALKGRISGEAVDGGATLLLSDTGTLTIGDLMLSIAGAKLDGDMALGGTGLPSGHIRIDAPNLARLGNATGIALKGRVNGNLELAADGSRSIAKMDLAADDIAAGDLRIKSVRSAANISNLLEAPDGTGRVTVSGVAQGSKMLGDLSLDTRFNDGVATFTSKGRIDNGTFALSGSARAVDQAHEIEFASASYSGRSDLPAIRLSAPARLSLRGDEVTTQGIRIAIGDGAASVKGSAGSKALDLKIAIERVPASVASIAAPELGIAGSINGTATVKGDPSNPQIRANIAASGLSAEQTRSNQLPAADITTDILAADGKANVKIQATARGGVDLAVNGTVGLKADGAIKLSSRGTVPLALANVFLADRATRIGGVAKLTADISGPLSAPRIDGRLSVDGATMADSELGLDITSIDADVGFSQDNVVVRKLVAASKKGGNITAGGTVALRGSETPTMDASIKLAAFKFGNQDPVAGEISGDVKVSGPLEALVARGEVLITRMDITVPSSMPRSVSSLDIRHVNAPARFQSPKSKNAKAASPPAPTMPVSLTVDVRASDRIFVRGRGVDAQLGGFIKVRGTAEKPLADGQFTMSRGKLSILGRQLDFSRGNIVFIGSLEPTLDLEAQADADGTMVTIKVTGPASQPKLEFTSSPELPEDEIVSLLLFNKKLASLSPSQLIQLASEVDKIGGLSSGPGAFDKMKSAMGIDVLDVTTDEQGKMQATAGSYVNDKTYIGVKQGMSVDKSTIVVDHELTKNIKARGEVGTDGKSKLGLGFEWNY